MCKTCINQMRALLTKNNDQENLTKLVVIEEANELQEKATGGGLDAIEIALMLKVMTLDALTLTLKEYKQGLLERKQMQYN